MRIKIEICQSNNTVPSKRKIMSTLISPAREQTTALSHRCQTRSMTKKRNSGESGFHTEGVSPRIGISSSSQTLISSEEQTEVDDIFAASHNNNNNNNESPNLDKMEIQVGYRVLNIANIDNQQGTFEAEVYLFFTWNDSSLRVHENPVHISKNDCLEQRKLEELAQGQPKNWKEHWKPLIRCQNLVKLKKHEYMCEPNDREMLSNDALERCIRYGGLGFRQRCFRVDESSGTVVLETRLCGTFRSHFDLKLFPFDYQVLEVVIAEVEHSKVTFVEVKDKKYREKNCVSCRAEMGLRAWKLHHAKEDYRKKKLFSNVASATFTLQIFVRRRSTFYVVFIMAQFAIICGLSLLCFSVHTGAIEDRLSISTAFALAAVSLLFSTSHGLPFVPYMTIMSSFIMVGLMILFSSAVYCGSVTHLYNNAALKILPSKLQLLLGDWQPSSLFGSLTLEEVDTIAVQYFVAVLGAYIAAACVLPFIFRLRNYFVLSKIDYDWDREKRRVDDTAAM